MAVNLAVALNEPLPAAPAHSTAFADDIWDLSAQPYGEWVANGGCEGKWDFTAFGCSPVKEEMKRYLIDKMNVRSRKTAEKYGTSIKNIGRFISEDLGDIASISDMAEREVVAAFGEFMERRGSKAYKSRQRRGVIEEGDGLRLLRGLCVHAVIASRTCDLTKLDTWPTEDLPMWIAPHPVPMSVRPPRILFRSIPQEEIALDCKKYALFALKTHEASSISGVVDAFSLFFGYLGQARPEVRRVEQLERADVSGFMEWVNGGGSGPHAGNRALSALRTLIETGRQLGVRVPNETIVYEKDKFKTRKKTPEYFSRAEQRRLLEHLGDLEPPYRWMMTVHYQVGMRVSDLCLLTEGCLKQTMSGNWYLDFFQHKTKKPNSVPITLEVKEAISDSIRWSKGLYGEGCRFVFAAANDRPITVEKYKRALGKYVMRNRILGDDGSLLNVRTHKFRATVATNMINSPGIEDPYLIMMYLGQARLGMLEHYAAIHGSTMVDRLAPITRRDEQYIQNLGRKTSAESFAADLDVPLCNGWCAKTPESGLCDNFNACYGCAMFRPSKDSLANFEHQLAEMEKVISIAQANGHQRILELNLNTKAQLEGIIAKLKSH